MITCAEVNDLCQSFCQNLSRSSCAEVFLPGFKESKNSFKIHNTILEPFLQTYIRSFNFRWSQFFLILKSLNFNFDHRFYSALSVLQNAIRKKWRMQSYYMPNAVLPTRMVLHLRIWMGIWMYENTLGNRRITSRSDYWRYAYLNIINKISSTHNFLLSFRPLHVDVILYQTALISLIASSLIDKWLFYYRLHGGFC